MFLRHDHLVVMEKRTQHRNQRTVKKLQELIMIVAVVMYLTSVLQRVQSTGRLHSTVVHIIWTALARQAPCRPILGARSGLSDVLRVLNLATCTGTRHATQWRGILTSTCSPHTHLTHNLVVLDHHVALSTWQQHGRHFAISQLTIYGSEYHRKNP